MGFVSERLRGHQAEPEPGHADQASWAPRLTARRGALVVQLPADVSSSSAPNAGTLVRAAWVPGITVVVADMALVTAWDRGALGSLLDAHRDLRSNGAVLRLVIWSNVLYAALQKAGVAPEVSVFANIGAALRGNS